MSGCWLLAKSRWLHKILPLPSPSNTYEPKRVCVWGRRAGDEGAKTKSRSVYHEVRLCGVVIEQAGKRLETILATQGCRELPGNYEINEYSGDPALTPVPSPRKTDSLKLANSQGEG